MPRESFAMLASKAAEAVVGLLSQQISRPQMCTVVVQDPALDLLQQVIDGFQTGKSIAGLGDKLAQLTSNQEQRSELINALVLSHDYSRLAKYMAVRSKLEDDLLAAASRDDLTASERVIMLKLVSDEAELISQRVQSSSTGIKDMVSLMNKVDYALQVGEHNLRSQYAKTTPQGREIVRRLAVRLSRSFNNEN